MPKKSATGWKVDVRPRGHSGPRFRKTFPSQSEALAYERYIVREHADAKPWDVQNDDRLLSEIAQQWFDLYGHSLTSGPKRLQQLQAICRTLKDPLARTFEPKHFIEYRKKRLSDGITANHLNHELAYFKSAFNELIRLNDWHGENPFSKIKKFPVPQSELRFLTQSEINKLLISLDESKNDDVTIVTQICLSIGCRWGEAQELTRNQIHNGKVHLTKTKNGHNRSIPINKSLEIKILEGRENKHKLFNSSWAAFENGIDRAKIELPKGQMTHVLRHTFASHFMMNGGDLLTLNKILGHQSIQMTMIYAHLSPDHLIDAMRLNPLSQSCPQAIQ